MVGLHLIRWLVVWGTHVLELCVTLFKKSQKLESGIVLPN